MNSQTIENIMNAREDIASAEIISSNLAIELAEHGQLRSTIARVQALAEESGASTKRRILDALEGRTYGKRFG